jgi:hypothetical protein
VSLLLLFHPRVTATGTADGAFSMDGTSTVQWAGASLADAAADSQGSATVTWAGASTAAADLGVDGASSVTWTGASTAAAALGADGASDAQWVSDAVAPPAVEIVPPTQVPDMEGGAAARSAQRRKRLKREDEEISALLRAFGSGIGWERNEQGLERLIRDIAPEVLSHYKKRVH